MFARIIKPASLPRIIPSSSFLPLRSSPIQQQHLTARFITSAAKMTTPVVIPRAERVAHFEQDVWSIFTPLALECQAVNLGQGFMNFPPPDFVIEAARDAVTRNDCNQYSHPKGRPRLRNALAKSYSPLFNRTLDPETEVVVTAGANEGIFSIFAGYLDQGSEVILMEPFFDQYISNITMNGGVPVYCPIRPAGDASKDMPASEWKIDIKELESKITPRSKIIVLNTPHNPIGKVFSREELEEIGALATKHNLLIISDEVYDRLYFDPMKHQRIATLDGLWERTITVGSGGKTFGTTGWRIGWLIGPKALVEPALAAHTRIVFCVNSPLQEAVAVGFEQADERGFFGSQIKAYEHKREKLLNVFRELGLPCTIPEGSYFILVNTDKIQVPEDYKFPDLLWKRPKDFRTCYWLTKEIGVCAIPPTEFYSKPNQVLAENFARFAFCKTDETLDAAAERLLKLKAYIK
ncbi:MAG: aminotransferase class I and II [Linnemannia elongata]|nr:MAG: aminotransferase class I and II [Linnemannia elongata]